jgi:hypothetical protein
MKHFFLINIFLIAALAFLLLITSGNSIVEHFETICTVASNCASCNNSGDCPNFGVDICGPRFDGVPGGVCIPRHPETFGKCKIHSDCGPGKYCFGRECFNRNLYTMDVGMEPNNSEWLIPKPNNANFCPKTPNGWRNFCPSEKPYCIYAYWNGAGSEARERYWCSSNSLGNP